MFGSSFGTAQLLCDNLFQIFVVVVVAAAVVGFDRRRIAVDRLVLEDFHSCLESDGL
jgi:hypothetical protein